jgi:hypothetical protein
MPQLIRFEDSYARGLTWNSIDLDCRLLSGSASTFDSIAVDLAGLYRRGHRSAVRAMPHEYSDKGGGRPVSSHAATTPRAGRRFYKLLAEVVDIHATDAADSVIVTCRRARRREFVPKCRPYFRRRFDERETQQVRLYLHGGDDRAEVLGDAKPAFKFRVIGGNGTNELVDESSAARRSGEVRLYDQGTVTGISYGNVPTFDRRPWVRKEMGPALAPGRDWGAGFSPAALRGMIAIGK